LTKFLIPFAAGAFFLNACSSEIAQVHERTLLASLGFLENPGASRQEVVGRLGEPAHTFENGRIVSYRVHRIQDRLTTHGWKPFDPAYDLVLVHSKNGQVERHSLVGRNQ